MCKNVGNLSGSKWKPARKKNEASDVLQLELLQHRPDSSLPLTPCAWERAQVLLLFHPCFIMVLPSQSTSSPAHFLAWCVSSPGLWQGLLIPLSPHKDHLPSGCIILFLVSQVKFTFLLFPFTVCSHPLLQPCPWWTECPAPAGTPCLLLFSLPPQTMEHLCWNDPQDHPSFLNQDLQGVHLAYSICWRCDSSLLYLFIHIKSKL